jgi:glycosyltransferase involved in cell wall biosynthesis
MRIALVDNVSDPVRPGKSGHSDIIWTLARHFTDRGHSVIVVAPYTSVDFSTGGVTIVPVLKRGTRINVLTSSLLVFRMMKRVKELGVDIVQATDAFSAGAGALFHLDNLVFMVSGNVYQRIHAGYGLDKSAEWGYRFWSKLAAKGSRAVICTSDDMSYWWRKTGFPSDRIHRIPLGVDTQAFQPKELNLAGSEPILLCVARLAEENNVDLAIKAVAESAQLGCSFRTVMVGDGPLRSDLQAYANHLGLAERITWLGRVDQDDLPNLYRTSDIFLFTRLYGGPPRVVLEAMASGLPILGFSASGIDSYVQDGSTGFLHSPGDTSELAASIIRLAKNGQLRRKVGQESRSLAEDRYDWAVVVDQLLELYVQIARDRKRADSP